MTIEAVTFAQQLQAGQIKIGADKALSYGRPGRIPLHAVFQTMRTFDIEIGTGEVSLGLAPSRTPLHIIFRKLRFKQMIEYMNDGVIEAIRR